jgi:hypothetical protein
MRAILACFTALFLAGASFTFGAGDDDALAVVAKQKQALKANMAAAQISPSAVVESANLLLCGTLSEAKFKSLSNTLEKQLSTAVAGLQFEKNENPWPGKLGVYVFADRSQFRSFVRVVEKRSPDDAEQGTLALKSDIPHVAVGPGRSTSAPTLEAQAGLELAAAILTGRAKATPLPEWVTVGFGRATAAHAAAQAAGVRKKGARDLIRGRLRPRDAWNEEIPYDQRMTLAAAVMDFIVYGGGVGKASEFLGGFRPDDEKPTKSPEDALAAAKLSIDQFEAAFIKWLGSTK